MAKPPVAMPLGPESLTWRYFGDLRTSLFGMWVAASQNMLPDLGAGVEEHSIVGGEPLARVARSMYPILGVVYDGDRAAQTGHQIVGFHHLIKGQVHRGWGNRQYHALDPDTFYWAHVTFFMQMVRAADVFCGGLCETQRRQLWKEHLSWYAQYGMPMGHVPKTYEEFQDYWDHMCAEVLEINKATTDILNMHLPKPKVLPMPTWLWNLAQEPFVIGQRWLASGAFDPVVRRRAEMDWSQLDELLLRAFGIWVEYLFMVLPEEIRLHPRALAAVKRARGELPSDAPLPQAPALFGPPAGHNGSQHYHPKPQSPPLTTVLPPQLLAAGLLGVAGVCAVASKVIRALT